jgi:hypothetical protein
MKLDGVPKGYEAVRFGWAKAGDFVLNNFGQPEPIDEDMPAVLRLIVRKVEPVATWIHGVFQNGWIAEDSDGLIYWYSLEPKIHDGEEWEGQDDGKCQKIERHICFLTLIKFREDLPYFERIVAVGPIVEGGAT